MVNSTYINKIRTSAWLINTSRGKIFSEDSYYEACSRLKTLMDVFPLEPPIQQMTYHADFISPHVAGYNYSARAEGTRRVALDFASHLGYDSNVVPRIPDVEYEINVIDFLEGESRALKMNPDIFSERRLLYPHRCDFSATRRSGEMKNLTEFRKLLLDKLS